MNKAEAERIILGSGYIHIGEFKAADPLPDPQIFCTDDNIFSYISGGATLNYSPSYYEAKDDMGKVSKTIITEEEATLKAGLMTFNGKTLDKLVDTARESEKTVNGKKYRVVKVGGVGNRKGKKYIICFHHVDPVDGDIFVMIVGNNQAGFELSFVKDAATVVNAEFHAMPMDGEGTLIEYAEEIKEDAPGSEVNPPEKVYIYEAVTDTDGKNPQEEGWFETDGDGSYTLTADTAPESGKTYYTRSENVAAG